MKSKLSILGLYNYDESVFSGFQLPAELSRNIMIDYICMECADLELVYPELDIMKKLISSWSIARLHSWEKLYESTVQNFNMIHNYDRYEDWSDSGNRNSNVTTSAQAAGNANTNETTSIKKPGYNVSSGDVTVETQQRHGTNSTSSNSSGQGTEYENTSGVHNGHMYGNIGVTTAAQMLEEVRDLYKWDIYAAITKEFKERFCIMLY